MTRREFLHRFVTVHKCGGCGDILDNEHTSDAFCQKCRLVWDAARLESCGECFKPAIECGCMPKELSRAGALCLHKLFFYKSEEVFTPQIRLIYYMKRKKSRRMTEFVAAQLLPLLKEELEVIGADDIIVTNVPRGRKSRTLYGFDQSELVAKRIAENIGAEYVSAFYSRLGSKIQKDLDRRGRLSNAKKNIMLKKDVDVRGRYAVLVDDMVTTGASMSVCTKMLMEQGAMGVICLSLASKNKM